MRRWAGAVVVALLWLTLPGGVGARREAKRTRQPSQRGDPPTAAASLCEGMPEAPKPSQASGPAFSDARRTWLNFIRRPDTGALRKRCRGRDTKPRGLLSPPGPPGAETTPETLLWEFQEMLKEAAEHRFSGLLVPVWPPGVGPRLLGEAFHCRLKGPRQVDRWTLVEDGPGEACAFLRGSGLSLASGRFTAPASSIFQFSASLHVGEPDGAVLCAVTGLGLSFPGRCPSSGWGWLPTVVTSPCLSQAGQYASVFVDNGSGAVLTIQAGSSFSGLLLGT
uniref:C1q and TNF related 12 n=1 Tax=Aotus nancymaae TaxID=37293 RepID=A0A2K5ENV7_AOTNA